MDGTGLKLLENVNFTENGQKLLFMAVNGCKCLEMAGNSRSSENGYTWLEIAVNGC